MHLYSLPMVDSPPHRREHLESVIISSLLAGVAELQAHSSGLVSGGKHKYTDQLMALNKCRPVTTPIQVGSRSNVTTPLHYEIWAEQLSDHPDRAFVSYRVTGLCEGFRIGFNRSAQRLQTFLLLTMTWCMTTSARRSHWTECSHCILRSQSRFM